MNRTPRAIAAGPRLQRLPVLCALIVALTLFVFWPVGRFEFQSYDDQRYVAGNPMVQKGLTFETISWAFSTFQVSNWHPLTWISHMVDVQLFGLNAGAHHFTNLFLHLCNSVLLLLVLSRMTAAPGRSWMVAALFALHPMHVESVAWIAERKDVLSTLFFMLTLWEYARYVEETKARYFGSKVPRPKSARKVSHHYIVAMVFFALGLLSKPMLVTLPFVLLLLDVWPLYRIKIDKSSQFKSLTPVFLEKVPFLLLSAASCVMTFMAQHSGGSVASLELFSLESRVGNALAAYAGYLQKLFWPSKLAVLYLPASNWQIWQLTLSLLMLSAITGLVLNQFQRRPYLAIGWFWFLGTLIPVIGLVQVGSQYMADRYSYVPFIGCFISLVWGGWDILISLVGRRGTVDLEDQREKRQQPTPYSHLPPQGAVFRMACGFAWTSSLVTVVATGVVTRNQLEYWRTPESLFRHCIQVTSNNYIAESNLGAILVNQRRYAEAKPFYAEALRINPNFPDAVLNMGTLLALEGDLTNAMQYLQKAVQLAPESAESYGKLGMAFSEQGRMADAITCYRESLRLKPNQVPGCNNLAWILATSTDPQVRNGAEAVGWAQQACQLTDYKQPMMVGTLAAAYAEAGRFPDAITAAQKAISLATDAGQKELAQKNRELLALYQAGKPYRDEPKR